MQQPDTQNKPRLTIVAGTPGSGKTTLIRSMLTDVMYREAHIVQMEYASYMAEGPMGFAASTNAYITVIGQQCRCCSHQDNLIQTVEGYIDKNRPIIIEANGYELAGSILARLAAGGILKKIELSSVITIIDANRLHKRPEFDEYEPYTPALLAINDIVYLSKINDENRHAAEGYRMILAHDNITTAHLHEGGYDPALLERPLQPITVMGGEEVLPDYPKRYPIFTNLYTESIDHYTDEQIGTLWQRMHANFNVVRMKGRVGDHEIEADHTGVKIRPAISSNQLKLLTFLAYKPLQLKLDDLQEVK